MERANIDGTTVGGSNWAEAVRVYFEQVEDWYLSVNLVLMHRPGLKHGHLLPEGD